MPSSFHHGLRALVGVVGTTAVVAAAAISPASAYQTGSVPNSPVNPIPGDVVATTVDTSIDDADQIVDPDQEITYTVSSTAKAPNAPQDPQNPQPGQTGVQVMTLTFAPDPAAPLDSELTEADFKLVGQGADQLMITPPRKNDDGSWTVGAVSEGQTSVSEVTLTGTLPATVSKDVTAGTKLHFGALGKSTGAPFTYWNTEVPAKITRDSDVNPDGDKCTGSFEWRQTLNGSGYGLSLMDLTWGAKNAVNVDFVGEPVVEFTKATPANPTTVAQKVSNETNPNLFPGYIGEGEDPFGIQLPPGEAYQDVDWAQGYHWTVDTHNGFSNAYVADGATVHVKQNVRAQDCAQFAQDHTDDLSVAVVLNAFPLMEEGKGSDVLEFTVRAAEPTDPSPATGEPTSTPSEPTPNKPSESAPSSEPSESVPSSEPSKPICEPKESEAAEPSEEDGDSSEPSRPNDPDCIPAPGGDKPAPDAKWTCGAECLLIPGVALALTPFVISAASHGSSGSSAFVPNLNAQPQTGTAPGTPKAGAPAPATTPAGANGQQSHGQQPGQVQPAKNAQPQRSLARTGASVLGIVGVAALLIVIGLWAVSRRREEN